MKKFLMLCLVASALSFAACNNEAKEAESTMDTNTMDGNPDATTDMEAEMRNDQQTAGDTFMPADTAVMQNGM